MNALGMLLLLAPHVSDEYCTAELDRLLALHDDFGLPHPPATATLVRYVHLPDVRFENGKRITRRYDPALGFSRDGRTVINYKGESVEVESIATVKPDPTVFAQSSFGWLDDALHYHARGWTALSRAAYRRWLRESPAWAEPDRCLARRSGPRCAKR